MIKAQNLIAGRWQDDPKASTFQTVNPKTNEALPTSFQEATSEQIHEAVTKAAVVFDRYATTSFSKRVKFLKAIQSELEGIAPVLLKTYQEESALPQGRAEGELQRTLGQIQSFIALLEEGSFVQAVIHTQGPDLRKMLYPIGPIGVFGASNFPLAFSTAGGDTISALAAGCPVILKAHPYHAGTSALVAEAIHRALKSSDLPLEIFSHLGGISHSVGSQLVMHPMLKAVGFTGSFIGGKALYDLAQNREEPIPVFAEMGSINPMFITENCLRSDDNLVETLAQSIVLGSGQFCTNPGMILCCDSSGENNLIKSLRERFNELSLTPMVHSNIEKKYLEQLKTLEEKQTLELSKASQSNAALGWVTATDLLKNHDLMEEVFGPFSLLVACKSIEEMTSVAAALPGQLTATLLSHETDHPKLGPLIGKLQNKVGRLLFEGVPTGVAVTQAMQHGGPFPAATDSRFSSVGTDAVFRWLRPITYQDCPNTLLPEALRNENPLALTRTVDGQQTQASL